VYTACLCNICHTSLRLSICAEILHAMGQTFAVRTGQRNGVQKVWLDGKEVPTWIGVLCCDNGKHRIELHVHLPKHPWRQRLKIRTRPHTTYLVRNLYDSLKCLAVVLGEIRESVPAGQKRHHTHPKKAYLLPLGTKKPSLSSSFPNMHMCCFMWQATSVRDRIKKFLEAVHHRKTHIQSWNAPISILC
jgi:hypothetical protein